MKVILPKTFVNVPHDLPLFFLAGPVRGGGDWQYRCCLELAKILPDFVAVLPTRYADNHPLMESRLGWNEGHFDRQLTWERHYLEEAARSGCILFWLPEEDKEHPHPGPEPYGMDTRGELGEWRGQMMYDGTIRLVIGAEVGFHGLSQIQRNFEQALKRKFTIHETLEATVAAAVHEVRSY